MGFGQRFFVSSFEVTFLAYCRWRIQLPPIKAGGPYTISAVTPTGGEGISLDDVLFGDVWVCSGQSNMGFTLSAVIKSLL